MESEDSSSLDYEEIELKFMSSNSDEAESSLLYEPGSSLSSSSSTSHRAYCHQGFSIQYQPKIFEDIIGHDMVIRALSSAIRLNKISPMYLFSGPPGTGKTSAARIFATALNCESSPAKLCSGYKSSWFEEIHKFLRKATSSGVKVVIIDIKLASESWPWGQLLNLVQENKDKIFILLTEDARTVPRAVSSRCQKYKFSKLSDTDVMSKLSRIVAQEGIEIRKDALKLIARRADGNLREAENLLDHLALLDMKIDTSTIEQLVGLVPRNKLVRLLETKISGNSTDAVRSIRDLIASGIEPREIVSQLASLVTEILADSYSSSIKGNMAPEKLCQALNILIETEKQLLAFACNHTARITAAILQIESDGISHHIPSVEKSDITNNIRHPENNGRSKICSTVKNLNNTIANSDAKIKSFDMDEIWNNILQRMQNKSMRDFLRSQAKLLSLTVARDNAIIHLMLKHSEEIPESLQTALKEAHGCPVTLNISHQPAQQDTVTGNIGTQIDTDGRGLLMEPRSSQESVATESNLSFTKVQYSAQIFPDRTRHRVSLARSGSKSFLSEQSTHVSEDTDLKLRLLSISSIPQIDASVEPYSQDLLYEETNPDRKHRERNKLYKDFIGPKQHINRIHDTNMGLNHSRSCTENFCRGETTVNKDTTKLARNSRSCTENFCRGETTVNKDTTKLARRSHLLNWASMQRCHPQKQ